jgi:hypothetical protein
VVLDAVRHRLERFLVDAVVHVSPMRADLALVAEARLGDDPVAHSSQVQLDQPAAVDPVAEGVPGTQRLATAKKG